MMKLLSCCANVCAPRMTAVAMVVLMAVFLWLDAPAFAKTPEADTADILGRFSATLAKVADDVKPAVVNISTTKTVKQQRHPFFDDPFFRRFFGDGLTGPQKRRVSNLGSGVITSPDGYIITCNHVIDGAEDIVVKLSDNREFKGKVVGSDSRTDIAVIKIEEKKLPFLALADSDKLKVGELILAIGQPFGLKHTVTMGIISALGRVGLGITDYEDFIQTDAAINPGNSGGALVNMKGELIGINNAIFSTSGGYQGIGFAIPSNMVRAVMDSIVTQGKVVRGWLGVQIQPLTQELVTQFNLKDDKGVLLSDVMEGGPAEKSGLKRGDVIVEYDGKKVESPFSLKNMVASTLPGKSVQIKVIRDGNPVTVKVTIGELPAEAQIAGSGQFENALRGVSVQEVTDDILKGLGVTRKIRGVVVSNVDDDSPAAGILTKGDIITEVNRKTVATMKDFTEIVSKIAKNQGILLTVFRGGNYLFITLPGQ